MIINAPIKFRLMELFEEEGPMWNYEVILRVMEEYNMHSQYQQQMVNYDLIEMVSAGFLTEEESVVDTEGRFHKDHLLMRYQITNLGIETVDGLKKKVKHYE